MFFEVVVMHMRITVESSDLQKHQYRLRAHNMNSTNGQGQNSVTGNLYVCTVKSFGIGRFGFAEYRGSRLYFNMTTGHEIVAGHGKDPIFTDNTAVEPAVGDVIIAKVAQGPKGWYATAWGSHQEYEDAQGIIALRNHPKPAPVVPMPATVVNRRRCPRIASAVAG